MNDISYWLDIPYTPGPALEKDIETDIVVIGGGITGVSTAYHCARSGFKTVLIEKECIAAGSAGKNGGMVVEGLAMDFREVVEAFGEGPAREAWQRTIDSREHVAALIEEHGIECGFSRVGSLYLVTSSEDTSIVLDELKARKDSGFSGEIIPAAPTAGTALCNANDCVLHPVKFVRGLAKAAEAHGLIAYERTPAISFDARSVITPRGTITAERVVVAIESNKSDLDPEEAAIHRELALVTEPLPEKSFQGGLWDKAGMFWTTGRDYLTVRRIGTRLFIDGNISMDPSQAEIEDTQAKLIQTFLRYCPEFSPDEMKISHRWTGLLLYPKRNRPFMIDKGYYEWFGNGGNGLTNGVMAGKLLAEFFLGKDIPGLYQALLEE